uniref:Putative triabin n=1 Tax=Triatoma dimidiata TaxID=72491 RepID=A0A0V0G4M9_TRIDM
MKTFIALTFIGILTYAYAEIGSLSECKKPKAMDGFSATRFHKGLWYVTHVTNVTEPTECRTLTTSKVDNKYIVEHDFTKGGIQGRLHCEAPREAEKRLTFTCTFNGESIDKTIFIVMDTDYNDYALYYICSAITGANADRGASQWSLP